MESSRGSQWKLLSVVDNTQLGSQQRMVGKFRHTLCTQFITQACRYVCTRLFLISLCSLTLSTCSLQIEKAQLIIDKAMESGSLQQRNAVGVITGLMGSGKTTLLYHLFGEPPPDLYTSTGVAEQSFRGLLHHTLHLSARTWQRLSHKDIREPLIRARMREAAVDYLASRLVHDLNPTATTSVPTNPLDPAPTSTSATASVRSKTEASHSPTKPPPLPWAKSPSCQEMVPRELQPVL